VLDVDHFADVNTAFGRPVGDTLLVAVAARVKRLVQATDTVARLDADRFAIWLEACSEDAGCGLAERVVRAIGEPFATGKHSVSVTVSVGVTTEAGDEAATAESLMRDASIAAVRAKELGRGRVKLFDFVVGQRGSSPVELRAELLNALKEGHLMLHYQPEIALENGHMVGAEALIRWQHPERGLIPPVQFIPAAEESDVILAIGRWVLETACRDAASWPGTTPAVVSVNLSARQFTDPNLQRHISDALRISGLPANRLCVEVTETLVMRDIKRTATLLEAIRAMGVLIAVDDFGTGHSSLAYLTDLPVDYLKIDRAFVAGLDDDSDRRGMVAAVVIDLADRLGLKTIGEGVETPAQAEALRNLGCDVAQGYLYGRPAPHQEFLERSNGAA
jgi:diguanylate cyclase (GGDEF)-like protein